MKTSNLRLSGVLFFAVAVSVLCHLVLLFLMAGRDRAQVAPVGLSGVILKANLVGHTVIVPRDQLAAKASDISANSSAGAGDGLDTAAASSSEQRSGSTWRRSYASRESVYGLMSASQRQAQQNAEQLLQGRQASSFVKEIDAQINGIKHDECAGNIPISMAPAPSRK